MPSTSKTYTPKEYNGDLYTGDKEPRLADLYADPVLLAMLKCDGLPLSALKNVVNDAKRRLVA